MKLSLVLFAIVVGVTTTATSVAAASADQDIHTTLRGSTGPKSHNRRKLEKSSNGDNDDGTPSTGATESREEPSGVTTDAKGAGAKGKDKGGNTKDNGTPGDTGGQQQGEGVSRICSEEKNLPTIEPKSVDNWLGLVMSGDLCASDCDCASGCCGWFWIRMCVDPDMQGMKCMGEEVQLGKSSNTTDDTSTEGREEPTGSAPAPAPAPPIVPAPAPGPVPGPATGIPGAPGAAGSPNGFLNGLVLPGPGDTKEKAKGNGAKKGNSKGGAKGEAKGDQSKDDAKGAGAKKGAGATTGGAKGKDKGGNTKDKSAPGKTTGNEQLKPTTGGQQQGEGVSRICSEEKNLPTIEPKSVDNWLGLVLGGDLCASDCDCASGCCGWFWVFMCVDPDMQGMKCMGEQEVSRTSDGEDLELPSTNTIDIVETPVSTEEEEEEEEEEMTIAEEPEEATNAPEDASEEPAAEESVAAKGKAKQSSNKSVPGGSSKEDLDDVPSTEMVENKGGDTDTVDSLVATYDISNGWPSWDADECQHSVECASGCCAWAHSNVCLDPSTWSGRFPCID